MSHRDRVGAEFLGLARQFRGGVIAADRDYIALVQRINASLETRLASRKPILSKRLIMDTVLGWRAMPTPYRLALDAELGSQRRLTLTEWRLAATSANNTEWVNPEWEDGVAIVKVTLTTTGGSFNLSTAPHSMVSRHALARWYKRSGKRDDPSLVRDITALLTTNEPDRVRCHNGMWLASVITAHGHGRTFRLRDVRTFIPIDDTPLEVDDDVSRLSRSRHCPSAAERVH